MTLRLAISATRQIARTRLNIAEGRMAAVVFAVWVSLCAACPEFIWRGLRIAFSHTDRLDLDSIVLVGIILTIFVEPIIENLRRLLHRAGRHGQSKIHFAAAEGFLFALAAIELHHAILAFVTNTAHGSATAEMDEALRIGLSWAMAPFAITLCWLGANRRLIWVPAAAAFALSFWVVRAWFGWTDDDLITTGIPATAILCAGMALMRRQRGTATLRSCAWVVAGIAGLWLAANLVIHSAGAGLYTGEGLWMDLRYYIGWTLGLLLAPSPFSEAKRAA